MQVSLASSNSDSNPRVTVNEPPVPVGASEFRMYDFVRPHYLIYSALSAVKCICVETSLIERKFEFSYKSSSKFKFA